MSIYTKVWYPHTHGTLKKVTHFEGEYLSSGYPQNVQKKIAYRAFKNLRTIFFWYPHYGHILVEQNVNLYQFLGFRLSLCEPDPLSP